MADFPRQKIIIVGRTEPKLQSAVQELGHNTAYYVLDTGNIGGIPTFIKNGIQEHPEADCLINNMGVQRSLDVNDFDVSKVD